MTDTVEINGKAYHPIRTAAKVVLYSADHVTKLARENKVNAVQLGRRRWFVQIESLRAYAEVQKQEQAIKQKHLRLQRKMERKMYTAVTPAKSTRQPVEHRVAIVICGVLCLGVVTGLQLSNVFQANANIAAVVQTKLAHQSRAVQIEQVPKVLQPVFVGDVSHVVIEADRVVKKPFEVDGWRYIHHE